MQTWPLTACACGYTANHLLSHTAEKRVHGSAVKCYRGITPTAAWTASASPTTAKAAPGTCFEEDVTRRGGPSAGQSCGAARAARHVASLPRTAEGISRLLLRCASSPRTWDDVQRFNPGWERGRGGCRSRDERRTTCTVCQCPDTDAAPSLNQVRVGAAPRAASLCPRAFRDSKSGPRLFVALERSQPRGDASKGPPTDT